MSIHQSAGRQVAERRSGRGIGRLEQHEFGGGENLRQSGRD
jgi:hypothetical protein